ncbi:MAG TPA: CehA/McbA family metallohydrolase [Gemmataceae bacterium]|nr:CehA/McbA family metallohydrolase [Gemmataceae bacterium]
MSAALHTVHVRVNDAATGQPTPVRVRFTSPDGTYFAPFGRLAKFAIGRYRDVGGSVMLGGMLGERHYAYIDGTCEVSLPAGPIVVEISKGPEYRPLRREVSLSAGKLALRFNIERWTNLREQGWYSGDTNALLPMPHAALMEAAAEDLAVVNLLATQVKVQRGKQRRSYTAIPNMLAFSGQQAALEMPGHLIVVNTQNYHRVLGSLGLLNCHRAVSPLVFGRPEGMDNWTLSDWCDQCHRKGGLVVWTRTRTAKVPEDITFLAGEALANFVLRKVDAFEVAGLTWCSWEDPEWYGLLNSGLRVTFVGASNKDSNLSTLGYTRTYAHLAPGAPLTYANWIEVVRAGRTFVTNGPLLSFTVNDQEPGATVHVPHAGQMVRIRVEAQCVEEFDRVEVLLNGKVIASEVPTGPPYRAAIEMAWPVQASGWLAARCWGTREMNLLLSGAQPGAHTSPVYVRVAEQPMQPDPAAVSRLQAGLDYMLQWVEQSGRFENDRQREQLRGIFLAAKARLSELRAGR